MHHYQLNRISNTISELIEMFKITEKSVMVVSSSTSDKCYEKVETKDTTCTHGGISKEGKQSVVVPTAAGMRLISEGRCF